MFTIFDTGPRLKSPPDVGHPLERIPVSPFRISYTNGKTFWNKKRMSSSISETCRYGPTTTMMARCSSHGSTLQSYSIWGKVKTKETIFFFYIFTDRRAQPRRNTQIYIIFSAIPRVRGYGRAHELFLAIFFSVRRSIARRRKYAAWRARGAEKTRSKIRRARRVFFTFFFFFLFSLFSSFPGVSALSFLTREIFRKRR